MKIETNATICEEGSFKIVDNNIIYYATYNANYNRYIVMNNKYYLFCIDDNQYSKLMFNNINLENIVICKNVKSIFYMLDESHMIYNSHVYNINDIEDDILYAFIDMYEQMGEIGQSPKINIELRKRKLNFIETLC